MKITIFCTVENVRHDSLNAAVLRTLTMASPEGDHAIHVGLVEPDGFQETLLIYDCNKHGGYTPGQSFVVGQVQRTPDAPFEYHS